MQRWHSNLLLGSYYYYKETIFDVFANFGLDHMSTIFLNGSKKRVRALHVRALHLCK